MKNLKALFVLCIIMCVVVAVTSCDLIQQFIAHPFDTAWTYDETQHWHACTDEGCEEISEKAEHTFGEGKVTTPATEAAEGVKTYECTVCGYKKTESIPKLAHTHNLSKVDKVAATCTTSGTEAYYTCSGCALIFADEDGKNVIEAPAVIPMEEHDWEDATCEAPNSCINCDATEGQKLDHTPADPVEENRVEATCGKAGSYDSVIKCDDCGFEISREAKEIPATGNHVYSTEIERVPAKCEVDGYIVKKCTCGATEKTTLKAPGYHTYDNDEDMICNIAGCGFDRTCKHVNTEVIPAVDATCTSNGLTEGAKCKDCGHITLPQTETEMADHTPSEPKEENRVEAKCDEVGSYDKVVYCTVCNKELNRETISVDKLGHTEGEIVVENNVDPKCEVAGSYENVIYCTVCKAEVSRVKITVDALKHTEVIDNAVAATCTTSGLTEGKHCSVCDKVLVSQTVVDALGHKDENKDFICDVCTTGLCTEHVPAEAVKENEVAPTCEEAGYYDSVIKCSVCGEVLESNKITVDKLGHTKGEVVVENNVAPDCDDAGSYDNVVYCTVCKKELTRETITVDKLGHTEGEIVVENNVAPKCEVAGSYENVIYCTVCEAEVSRVKITVDALEHVYDDDIFDADCNNGCGTTRDIPHYITVTGGIADKEYAMVGDTVTLTANEAGENQVFSHWTVNGAKIEGNSFEMPNAEATVVAVFIDTVRKIDTPNNVDGKLVYRLANGEIQIDRLSGNSMFDTGVEYILIHIYESADATESLGQMILYVTPGADCQGGAVMIGYISTVDGSVKHNVVTGVKGNYWITGAKSSYFFSVLKAAVGYEYTAGATYYLAMQAIAYKTPVVENGIEITYLDSDISVIGPNGMVQNASAPSTIHNVKVDGGLIEGQYTELQVGYGNAVTFTTEAKEGYNFAGWYLTDENGEATGNALSADWSFAYTINGDTSIKAVFTQDKIKLATPDNSASKLIYKEGTGGAAIALDRAGKMFITGVDHVMFYVYTSSDANIEDYVARFVMYGYDGTPSTQYVTSFATLDGKEYKYIRGGNGGFYITDTVYFYNMLAELLGYDYSYGQNYYFAAQRIAKEGTIYEDSEISVIGSTGFARDESKSAEKFTVTVENGLIDGSLTMVEVGYGVVLNITSNPFEDGEFGCWRYVTYAEDGSETLGNVVSENADFALTVTSDVIIRSVALDDTKIKLEAPDNSNNQMITFNGATTEYDRQKNADGSRKTAFTEGVARIRYYMYVENTSGEKVLVGWFEIDREGYLYEYNGTKSSFGTNGGKCYGELGNLYGTDGNWHNLIKRAYNQGAAEKGLSSWNNNDNHYFACQAITDNPDLYQNSEIGAMGKAWKSI